MSDSVASPADDEPLVSTGLKILYDALFWIFWMVVSCLVIGGQGRKLVDWGDGGSPSPGPLADGRLVGLTFLLPFVVMPLVALRHVASGRFRTLLTALCTIGAVVWLVAAVRLYIH